MKKPTMASLAADALLSKTHSVTSGSGPVDKAQYTPGPWTSTYYNQGGLVEVFNKPFGLGVICQCEGENALENAALIASAPELKAENIRLKAINEELLSALEDARFALYGNEAGNPRIDAAIAKAKDQL